MKIQAIKQDSLGYKLIAFAKVQDHKGCKPTLSPSMMADYKDGYLNVYPAYSSVPDTYNVGTWRNCLREILHSNFLN